MPDRLAVLADVHGNLVALNAVLADADRRGAEALVVAGDVSGFGPSPDLVLDLLRQRGAQMIRGNHEKDYVAPYATAAMPTWWATSPRLATMRWNMHVLGPDRRAYLAALPDRLMLDEATLVVHGSPRDARDAVTAHTPESELAAMYAGETCRLALCGHSHRPVVRELSSRRLVNVGSVGLPLDGDTRASYALVDRDGARQPGGWGVELQRIPYDVEAAVAAYAERGWREIDPQYVELLSRTLRTARDYFGPGLKAARGVPDDQFASAIGAYLTANP